MESGRDAQRTPTPVKSRWSPRRPDDRHGCPATWPTDGRDGGVPDPAAAGPQMIQIGNEGGFLPAPVVAPNQPVGYDYNRRDIVVLNVTSTRCCSGRPSGPTSSSTSRRSRRHDADPLQRRARAGARRSTRATTTTPATRTRPPRAARRRTLPGYGPNTRTIMQFQVAGRDGRCRRSTWPALQTALPAAYAASQPTADRARDGLRPRLRHHDDREHLLADPGHHADLGRWA